MKFSPAYYTYLLPSLPMLQFGSKAPFSFVKLLEMCAGLIPDPDIDIIREAVLADGGIAPKMQGPEKRWRSFDITLRNELVKIRAARKKIDGAKYLRSGGYDPDPSMAHVALAARRNPSILSAEKALDQERWNALDEIGLRHYFDIDALLVYAHKLLILEKWDKIQSANKAKILEEAYV